MATKQRTQVGTLKCVCCNHDIPAKASENGTLNLSCQWCDFTGYAKAGTEAHRITSAKLTNKPAPEPTPAPIKTVQKPEPTPTPKPAPRVPRSVFDL